MSRIRKKPNYISIIIWIGMLVCLSLLTYQIYNVNILPFKYYYLIGGGYLFIIVIFLIFIKNRKTKKWILCVFDIIFLLVIAACAYGSYKINDLVSFLNENLDAKYETNIYYILTNIDSKYNDINSIKNKQVYLIDDLGDKEKLEWNIKKVVDVAFNYEESISDLLLRLETEKDLIVIANSGNYDARIESDNILNSEVSYSQKVKIIETIEIKNKVAIEDIKMDMTNEPFVVYLSGIDTRSGRLPAKSLSDVNILLIVNPISKNVLILNTPRDYFVKLHGIDSMKDKLTHAGLVGGYKLSMETIGDLYEVDVKHYVRVNFNAVVKLVDAIGGITVNNELKKSFVCVGDPSCRIKPGDNKLNGKCALAFARERHAYKTGDRHRGENQQQVLTKVIEKVTSSKTLLMKSSDILNALNGTFETNIKVDDITALVKMQLDDMSSWNISTYSVDGTDAYSKTYLYPNNKLYVMNPNDETIIETKNKIKEILQK